MGLNDTYATVSSCNGGFPFTPDRTCKKLLSLLNQNHSEPLANQVGNTSSTTTF